MAHGLRASGRRLRCLCISGCLAALAFGSFGPPGSFLSREAYGQKKAAKAKKVEPPPPVPERKVTIARVNPDTRPQALAAAEKIDKLVEANYRKHKVEPNPLADDEVFVRRVYLDVTGRIPTYKQVRAFLAANDKDKRARLIDSLLNTDDYASNFYNFWADILRLNERLANNAPGRGYNEWVRTCLETNKPYDQWVYEMLTAEGKLFENPATGYIIRDSGMPLDAMNNTVRIFLGTQIGCAQCHDHPFDRWTQKEFYEMAAFTFGTQTRRGARDKMFGGKNVVQDLREELKKADTKFDGGGKYNRFLQGNLFEVFDTKNKLTLPHDYKYDDAKPKSVVPPAAIFDPAPALNKDDNPRQVFAKWLTSKDNPRFTLTIANRLWKKVFGVGQIDPVDNLKDETEPENPELMKFLTSEMIRVKYDLKEYLRILLNTKTYQREATVAELVPAEPYHFPGPVLRRMTAEQVWDSFITLAVRNPDEYQMEPARVQEKLLDVDLSKATAEEIVKRDQELREATNYKAREARNKNYSYKGLLLVRASELPQPLPPSHFLRQFGQSDRESIEGSSADGSVPQVLQMFNGPITHMLLDAKSLMYENVTSEKTPERRVDVIFLSVLGRRANPDERRAALDEVKTHGNPGYGNVIWALVNTREFLFVQ
jgi:hypothetical protein